MRTIALISDFGADSFYVGVMKAVLAAGAPTTPIVDVTHSIQAHAVAQGSFVLDRVFEWFSPGTVFLAVVDPGVGGDRRDVIVDVAGRSIVGPDNGIASEVVARYADARYVVIRESDPSCPGMGRTFRGRDVFAPAAAALARGSEAESLGCETDRIEMLPEGYRVECGEGRVRGVGRFVDSFGNVLSNVDTNHLAAAFAGRAHHNILVRVAGRDIGHLYDFYAAQPSGTLMAVVNSWGLVEISVNQGRAIDAFSAAAPERVSIELRVAP